ncbi:MAG: LrgB family protein [bacterium]|nr:LrgB family protein [bacterium]
MLELTASPFFGIALSIIAFFIGEKIQKKTGFAICNPLIIAIVLVIAVLSIFGISYESYNVGGTIINMFLAPATACLAVSVYTKIQILKENWLPIVVGCTVGSLASMGSAYLLCHLFGLDDAVVVSMIPKSVTTPIAVGISTSHGGIASITVVAVIFTGIFGNIAAPFLIRLFRVKDAMTAGLSIGACSHAVGTSKAIELGETEGAMSGLAIGVCGIITVLFSLFLH